VDIINILDALAKGLAIYPPLDYFGPVRGLLSLALCFAHLPVGGL
jgi:hypothetical protein